jgi:magnesium transporter
MLTSQYFGGDGQAAVDVPTEQIDLRLKDKDDGGVLWLEIDDPREEDFQMLGSEFGFHPLAIEDLQQRDQRPKVVEYGDYIFVVAHEWQPAPDRANLSRPCVMRSSELHIFVGVNYVVTVHKGESEALKTARKRWESSKEMRRQGAYFLLYLILDSLVDDYYPAMDAYDERTDRLEEIILKPLTHEFHLFGPRESDDTGQNPLEGILDLRRELLEMRRYVAPLRDAVNVLLRRVESVEDDAQAAPRRRDRARALFAYFQDVYDHTIRVVDTIDTYRDLLSGTLDAHLAVASNRLNEIVKVLTSVSIILMTWATVSGIYGMNFTDMPELHWRYGYPYALGLMAGLGILEWLYFRRRKWL